MILTANGDGHRQPIRWALVFTTLLAVGGCSNLAGPDYERPEVPEKTEWTNTGADRVSAADTIRPDWWTNFQDPYLNELVDKAVADNIDLRILAARVDKAGVDVSGAEADLLPRVSGTVAEEFQRATGTEIEQTTRVGTSLSWELDIWGKTRKGIAASAAEYNATEADWRAGYLTQVSEVASTYFRIRRFDEQIATQKKSEESSRIILEIFERQYGEGIVSSMKVARQRAEMINLGKQLLDLQRQRDLEENRLATLLGIPAGNFKVPVAKLTDTVQPLTVPPGLPSDLLTRRPDIIAAEYRVLKSYDLLGKAKLDKLPSFSLNGSGSMSAQALKSLLSNWSLALVPTLTFPLFDPSKDIAIKSSEVDVRIQTEQYRKTILVAFQEVEDTLINLESRREQSEVLEERLEELRLVKLSVDAQLAEGLISQLDVLESERSLLEAEQERLLLHQQMLADSVRLYKALGGGWPREVVVQQ